MSENPSPTPKRPAEAEGDIEGVLNSAKKAKLEVPLQNSEFDSAESNNDGLREKDVGISEYINSNPGFSAILKERYSDFMVHEIGVDGNVVRLTDTSIPPEEVNTEEVTNVISSENIELLQKLESSTEFSNAVVIEVARINKDARRKIHEAIRYNFHGLESTTEMRGDASIVIIVKKFNARSKNSRQLWPASRGNYTHFVLYKENKDTQDAINTIASLLQMPPKSFSYAGTKDKRAKTIQMVASYRVPAKRLIALNEKMKLMKLGNIQYRDTAMKLGDLSGNRFTIILRSLEGSREEVERAMNSLEAKGFINYYGMQRFGTTSVATHHIGRVLIQSKWKEAVDLILKPRTGVEDSSLAASRLIWLETSDACKAYNNLTYKRGIEGCLLSGLKSHGAKDFVNALNAIPRNIRLMYIHSYQSFIWNRVVSKRINKHGLKILEGDLLLSHCKNGKAESLEDVATVEVKAIPKYVTKEDLEHVSIRDIVLPLPGHSVMYPNNETAEWYKEFLLEDGMDLNSFNSKVRSYSLGGSYRKIVVKPTDVKWEIIPYDDFCEPLVLSDYDIMQGVALPPIVKDGKLNALKVEFKLPSSCYATMAVRDILKMDTSTFAQRLLNKH